MEDPRTQRNLAERVFDFLRNRKRAYQLTFNSLAGQEVLIDLAKFCRANDTCFDADPRIHAALEGRREVFLRIANHLNLPTEHLYAIYNGVSFKPTPTED